MRLFAWLSLCLLYGNAAETLAAIQFVEPADKTLYKAEITTLVMTVSSKSIDTLRIIQADTTFDINVTAQKSTYCKSIKIKPGFNTVLVEAYFQGEKVQQGSRDLYSLPELNEGLDDEPQGYKQDPFHTASSERECVACHKMESNIPKDDSVLEDVTQTNCYGCHKEKTSNKNNHAPTANWLCTQCHDGTVGDYNRDRRGTSKYTAKDPIEPTCALCHENVPAWDKNTYVHGPVNDGRCNRCHNPHGSKNAFFLRKPIWELCTTCHAEKASGKHVVSSFVFGRNSGAHPTQGRKDPSRPSRELVCSSCHDPHGSRGIYLLRMNGSMPFNVCQRCHKK